MIFNTTFENWTIHRKIINIYYHKIGIGKYLYKKNHVSHSKFGDLSMYTKQKSFNTIFKKCKIYYKKELTQVTRYHTI